MHTYFHTARITESSKIKTVWLPMARKNAGHRLKNAYPGKAVAMQKLSAENR